MAVNLSQLVPKIVEVLGKIILVIIAVLIQYIVVHLLQMPQHKYGLEQFGCNAVAEKGQTLER